MRKIAILPSLFTLANAVCGFASIIVASRIHVEVLLEGGAAYEEALRLLWLAGWLIFAGMVFDAFDGRVARLANHATRFGAELDSLCDVVTFGAAPAFLLLKLGPTADNKILYKILFVSATLYVLCTILRLARFNIETTPDEESHRYFKGLPSPAAAGCLASVAILRRDVEDFAQINHWGTFAQSMRALLPFLAIALACLMVSTVRYPHLVNQSLRGRKPVTNLIQILFLTAVLVIIQELALVAAFWGFAFLLPLWERFRRQPMDQDISGEVPATPAEPAPSPASVA